MDEIKKQFDNLKSMMGTFNEGATTAKTGFSLLGSLFTAALWVGLAALVWNVIPQNWRDTVKGWVGDILPEGWMDKGALFMSQNFGVLNEQALDALANMDPTSKDIVEALDTQGMNAELKTAVQNHWKPLLKIAKEQGGSLKNNNLITAGVIGKLMNDPANRIMAREIIGAIRPTSSGELPKGIATAMKEFIASKDFETTLGDAASRALFFEAAVGMSNNQALTVETLENYYNTLDIDIKTMRGIATAAMGGQDIQSIITPIIQNGINSGTITQQNASTLDHTGALETAVVANTMLTNAGFSASQIDAINVAATSTAGIHGAFTAMYTQNPTAAKALLSNTENLKTLSEQASNLNGAGIVGILLANEQGRKVVANIITALPSEQTSNVMAELAKSSIDQNTEATLETLRGIVIADKASWQNITKDMRSIAATLTEAEQQKSLNGLAGMLETLQSEDKTVVKKVVAGATSISLLDNISEDAKPLVRAIATAAGFDIDTMKQAGHKRVDTKEILTLLNNRDNRKALYSHAADGSKTNLHVLGEIMEQFSIAAPDNVALKLFSTRVIADDNSTAALNTMFPQSGIKNGDHVFQNLEALLMFVENMDANSGIKIGRDEANADGKNARIGSFFLNFMADPTALKITETNREGKQMHALRYSVGDISVSAAELAAFFHNKGVEYAGTGVTGQLEALTLLGNSLNTRVLAQTHKDMADIIDTLRTNLWHDTNKNGKLDPDEGLARILTDYHASKMMLESMSKERQPGTLVGDNGSKGSWDKRDGKVDEHDFSSSAMARFFGAAIPSSIEENASTLVQICNQINAMNFHANDKENAVVSIN
jgi:hypothetical protein